MKQCATLVATNQGFDEIMVKEASKAKGSRRSPRKAADAGDTRTERLVLRVHPDLVEVLTERAREKGLTRSAYVEQLLIGWVRLDPRNRRLDMIGKYVADAPDPMDPKRMSTFSFQERWRKFNIASRLLLGATPPSDWFPDQEDIPLPDPYSDEDPAVPP